MLVQVVCAVLRRVDFRGKGRLRARIRVPQAGRPVVRFPGGMRLRLDLRESLQRDFYAGVYDRLELRLVTDRLRGDFVDVGAHIGMYAVHAARAGRGRVLAFEPNPDARAQLEENVALNGCDNVTILPLAVGAARGRASLHVPASADPSFSSLEAGRFAEGEPVEVEVTSIDDAVREHGLQPSFVKVDVEGGEVGVLRGARETVATHELSFLVEVNERTLHEVAELLPGYRAQRVTRRRLVDPEGATGLFNVLFTRG